MVNLPKVSNTAGKKAKPGFKLKPIHETQNQFIKLCCLYFYCLLLHRKQVATVCFSTTENLFSIF